jgi:fructose-bisphosphate aldolase class II
VSKWRHIYLVSFFTAHALPATPRRPPFPLSPFRNLPSPTSTNPPSFLVFHGGSGSTKDEIREAVVNGVVKMNVDTDTQWAYLTGIRDFVQNKKDYLQTQVGNPEGADKPNKKQYDPRVWVREGEKTLAVRVKEACVDLGNEKRN